MPLMNKKQTSYQFDIYSEASEQRNLKLKTREWMSAKNIESLRKFIACQMIEKCNFDSIFFSNITKLSALNRFDFIGVYLD